MLNPYRVLDLTDERGEIAGMILGDLGADVIRVEPPGGSRARFRGPLLDDPAVAGPERSLQFFAYNRNKRSIVLDLSDDDDREVFLKLVTTVDIVLESWPDGALDGHGFDFDALRTLNPRIVHTIISPFGADGPAAKRPANDLTLSALGGQAALQGSPDRAPVRVSVPQVWRHAGAEAAAASLIGLERMRTTGEAQQVDVSAQCAVTWTTMNAMDAFATQGFDFQRQGSTVQMGVAEVDPVFACADGHIVALPAGNVVEALMGHMIADQVIDETWLSEDWATFATRLGAGETTMFTRAEVRSAFVDYYAKHTKRELYQIGLEAGVTIAPVNTTADLLEFDQLEYREAWHIAELPNKQSVRTVGRFALPTEPLVVRRNAPKLNEHADEIRAEFKGRATQLHANSAPSSQSLRPDDSASGLERSPRGRPAGDPEGRAKPFSGLNVLDLTWVIAGPASVRYFADHGATVVKVESALRPDGLRLLGPVRGDQPGWNRSQFYGEFNAGKQCIQLNLKHPDAVDILKRLVKWADVFVENWAPGALARLGLDYAVCREINPELIMVSTSLMGHTGPARSIAGFGYHAGAMAGYYAVTGWPDVPPHGPWLAYTDVIAPRFIAAMVTAALDHRRRTGEGTRIDASQFEMSLQFLAPELIDNQVSGTVPNRAGNRAIDAAPQGIYPCAGDDQWCAISVETDDQWDRLRRALGSPPWASDPALAAVTGRLEQHDMLDAQLSAWTQSRTPDAAMDELNAHGVPAGALQRSSDLAKDPQYQHRGFHRILEHAEMGTVSYAGVQFRIPGYRPGPDSPAPLLGEHTEQVLRDTVGLSAREIERLHESGALT